MNMSASKPTVLTPLLFTLKKWLFTLKNRRLLMPITLLVLLSISQTREIMVVTLSDSFWAVSSYVAFTLAIYHYFSSMMGKENKIVTLYHTSRTHQVVFSSVLGALPGCGGAIIVTTQFVNGKVGFGSIIAVLTATMGDAAFLLIAAKPEVGLGVMMLGVLVGIISGLITNVFHKDDFLRPVIPSSMETKTSQLTSSVAPIKSKNLQGVFWQWLLVPSVIIAGLSSFQVDINALFALPNMTIEWVGAMVAVSSMLLWALTKEINDGEPCPSNDQKPQTITAHPIQKVAQDTNFVSAWVIAAFVVFELSTHFANIDLRSAFSGVGYLIPLVGIAVGFLPGCGPQIVVTSLYLSGVVPMSAQLSNAISNDGDALFPMIALAPKAALVATIYSAIPAFIVGYGYYFLFEI